MLSLELFFAKWVGKAALIGVGFLAMLTWWQVDRSQYADRAVTGERNEQTRQAHENVDKATDVRTLAERAVHDRRLRGVSPDPYVVSDAPRR